MNDVFWNIFANSGNLDAFMAYKEYKKFKEDKEYGNIEGAGNRN
jgi:hypothetical protein